MIGIYKITSPSGKVYIGQLSEGIKRRNAQKDKNIGYGMETGMKNRDDL